MKTPMQIIDEIISTLEFDDQREKELLNEAKQRIETECTIPMSTGDNDYNIPLGLATKFDEDYLAGEKLSEGSDEWYDYCDSFDSKYSQYQV